MLHYFRHKDRTIIPSSYRALFLFLIIAGLLFALLFIASQTKTNNKHVQESSFETRLANALNSLESSIQASLLPDPVPFPPSPLLSLQAEALTVSDEEALSAIEQGLYFEQGLYHLQNILGMKQKENPLQKLENIMPEAKKLVEVWEKINKKTATTSSLLNFFKNLTENEELIFELLGKNVPERWLISIIDSDISLELLIDEGNIDQMKWRALQLAIPSPGIGPVLGNSVSHFWQNEMRSSLDLVVFVKKIALEQLSSFLGVDLASEIKNSSQANQMNLNAIEKLLQDPSLFLRFLPILTQMIEEKALFVFSPDPMIQSALANFSLTASVPSTSEKTDIFMFEADVSPAPEHWCWARQAQSLLQADNVSVTLQTKIMENGKIQHTLNAKPITDSKDIKEMLIMVPKNSALISFSNISQPIISDHSGSIPHHKNLQLQSHETSASVAGFTIFQFSPLKINKDFSLTYELPWNLNVALDNTLKIQFIKSFKNNSPIPFQHVLSLPKNLILYQHIPEEPIRKIEKDQMIEIVLGKK